MQNWRQIASEAKDLLTVCLAKAINTAMTAQVGSHWFADFAEEEAPKNDTVRITQPGQSSTGDLDLQALLKILRFRETIADHVLTHYGIFTELDEFTAQNQKRQLSKLLERLTKDFRNGIEAHTRSEDVEKRLDGGIVDAIYGDRQAFDDMCVLIRLFDKVTDKRGRSYASQLIDLPKRKKRQKFLMIAGAAVLAILAGLFVLLQPKTPANVYQSQRTPTVKQGEVTIQPIYVHYDGVKLTAECYVINGTDQTISDIDVYSLYITEGSRDIAAANFGILEGVTLAPGESVKWEFTFPKSTVFIRDAYLPDLQLRFSCRYS